MANSESESTLNPENGINLSKQSKVVNVVNADTKDNDDSIDKQKFQ